MINLYSALPSVTILGDHRPRWLSISDFPGSRPNLRGKEILRVRLLQRCDLPGRLACRGIRGTQRSQASPWNPGETGQRGEKAPASFSPKARAGTQPERLRGKALAIRQGKAYVAGPPGSPQGPRHSRTPGGHPRPAAATAIENKKGGRLRKPTPWSRDSSSQMSKYMVNS